MDDIYLPMSIILFQIIRMWYLSVKMCLKLETMQQIRLSLSWDHNLMLVCQQGKENYQLTNQTSKQANKQTNRWPLNG